MTSRLLIIGAGDVGAFIAWNLDMFDQDFEKVGILDDDETKVGALINGWEVLGPVSDFGSYYEAGLSVVIGIAGPGTKARLIERISRYEVSFPSFISRSAWVSNGVKIGKGVIIYPNVSINHGSVIEDFALINMNCAIGHDTVVGKYGFLSPGVSTGGFTFLEEGVQMGIGANTIQRIRIGRNAVIGGQCMLVKDVARNTTVVGVPGRPVGS